MTADNNEDSTTHKFAIRKMTYAEVKAQFPTPKMIPRVEAKKKTKKARVKK